MATRVMKTYELVWSPTGQKIGTVKASTKKTAIRKAPKPYSKYKGEIYATEIGVASNPRGMKRGGLIPAFISPDGRVFVDARKVKANPDWHPAKKWYLLRHTDGRFEVADYPKSHTGAYVIDRDSKPRLQAKMKRFRLDARKAKYKAKRNPLHAYDVYLRGRKIDTIFYGTNEPVTEVKRSLVNHDGYDPSIVVKKQRTRKSK